MATDTASSPDHFKQRKERAEAEKAAVEAELALGEAKKKQADSLFPIDPAKKARDAELAADKAAKESADARKARSDAELAAFKSRFGDIPAAGVSGAVKIEQGAGTIETTLLAARATTVASQRIVDAVLKVVPDGSMVFVYASGEVPDFQSAIAFYAQRAIVIQGLLNATSVADGRVGMRGLVEAVPTVAAAGVALDAVAKLLGYLKSDYEIRGSDVAVDHVLLAKGVAGALLEKKKVKGLYLRGTFNPSFAGAIEALLKDELEGLAFQRTKAALASAEMERNIADVQQQLATIGNNQPGDKGARQPLTQQLVGLQEAAEKLKAAIAAHDTFLAKLVGTDAATTSLIRELNLLRELQDSATLVLIVKMEKAGGSNFVQKNLWTLFGGIPFQVMAGVISTYSIFQGNSGALLASGIVPVHGGFTAINKIADLVAEK